MFTDNRADTSDLRKSNSYTTWYLGLDIGTSSVGWAVTNEQYYILRLRGQRAWGVRLFEEAETSAERRAHRIARRRYYRRGERLKYLQQIFSPYIEPIDPDFFRRIKDSFLWSEDKHEQQTNSLFNDSDYTDRDFYHDFPTIFHLRNFLMDPSSSPVEPKKMDARHYYLAIHHIVKYRGHFLFEGDIEVNTENTAAKFAELYQRLQSELLSLLNFEFGVIYENGDGDGGEVRELSFEEVLLDMLSQKGRLNDKKAKLRGLRIETDLDEEDRENAELAKTVLSQYLVGVKVDVAKIAEYENKFEIQLGQASTEDKIAEAPDSIGEHWQPILEIGKDLYNLGIVRQIIGESSSLSSSFVKLYQEYKEELDLYNANGETSGSKEKQVHVLDEARYAEEIERRGSKKIAKPKLRGYYKGAVPMQLHLAELKKILLQFEQAYPEFSHANTPFANDTVSVSDKTKIIKLLTHKVPYYVGPLQAQQVPGKQAQTERQKPWCTRFAGREKAKIYPWNFDTIIDKAVSAQNFIERMTNKCTYLIDQPCLPKDSVLYQKYMILNEINKLRIDGRSVDIQTKKDLFNDLFMKKTDIKLSTIKNYLAARGRGTSIAIADSEGTGGTINHKMTSYLKFKSVFGEDTDALLPQIEEAILSITILPDDKEMLRARLIHIFSIQLENGQIDETSIAKIANFNFSKWGNFSAKLLDGITADHNGFERTIIDWMWEENYNFMELMREEFGFKEKIEAHQKQFGYKSEEELINESYASVPVKRAARQAIKIIRELESIIGNPPAKVFIETPRSNEESNRTESRKAQLDRLYKNLKDDVAEYKRTKKELDEHVDNSELKRKSLYLYFLQNGKCAYSGDSLDIGALSTTCDIDHIIPQALLKDDSFDNTVLVLKEKNRAKKDIYPLNLVPEIDFSRMLVMWKSWHKNGLMTDKKFKSLTRTSLSIDEIAGFINRQLVETSQTTKMVVEILKRVMPDSELVYQKAETVAEFKREWALYKGRRIDGKFVPDKDENGNKELIRMIKPQFVKVRDLNDLHHAKDAYLNIVVGNVYSTRFTNNPYKWVYDQMGGKPEGKRNWSMRTVMYDDRDGEVKHIADKNGVVVWDEECLETVISTYERNDILISVRAFERHGAIFDQQIQPPGKGKTRFPIKKGLDVDKYGGYTGSYTTYFCYIRYKSKKRFAAIPIRFSDNPTKYLMSEYPECEILQEKIFIKSMLIVKGHPVTLDGSTGTSMVCSNLKQLLLSVENTQYVARLLKAKEKMKDKAYIMNAEYDRISEQDNIRLYQAFLDLAKGPYKTRPNIKPIIATLEEKQGVFEDLSLNDQVTVLTNIFVLFKRVPYASSGVNCKLLGGTEQSGTTSFSTYEEDIKLVITSVTGLYKRVIDLSEL